MHVPATMAARVSVPVSGGASPFLSAYSSRCRRRVSLCRRIASRSFSSVIFTPKCFSRLSRNPASCSRYASTCSFPIFFGNTMKCMYGVFTFHCQLSYSRRMWSQLFTDTTPSRNDSRPRIPESKKCRTRLQLTCVKYPSESSVPSLPVARIR